MDSVFSDQFLPSFAMQETARPFISPQFGRDVIGYQTQYAEQEARRKPNQQQIDWIRNNPDQWGPFDEKFGRGAAARALSQDRQSKSKALLGTQASQTIRRRVRTSRNLARVGKRTAPVARLRRKALNPERCAFVRPDTDDHPSRSAIECKQTATSAQSLTHSTTASLSLSQFRKSGQARPREVAPLIDGVTRRHQQERERSARKAELKSHNSEWGAATDPQQYGEAAQISLSTSVARSCRTR